MNPLVGSALRPENIVKALVVIATVVGAPILGISLTPKREAIAKSPESEDPNAKAAGSAPAAAQTSGFVGVLLPPQMATLSAYVDGRIDNVQVKLGQPVQKGQILLQFDPRRFQADLKAAEGSLAAVGGAAAAANAELQNARQKASRRNATVEFGGKSFNIVSGEEKSQSLSEATSAAGRLASAGGQMAEARARIEQLKLALEQSTIVAPFDGIITQLYVEQGATAHNGQPLVRVVGGQGLRARIAIPEDQAGVWQGRRRAQLELDNKAFWAVIDQVSPEVEPASRSYLIEGPVGTSAELCGGDCALLAGRPVRATLISDKE